jgi:hypothetical protein
MSEFTVEVDEVAAAAARLATICGDLEGVCSGLGGRAGAGAETSAGTAVSGFVTHLVGKLPEFGVSTERLRAAVAAGGGTYARADADIAAASDGAAGRG